MLFKTFRFYFHNVAYSLFSLIMPEFALKAQNMTIMYVAKALTVF